MKIISLIILTVSLWIMVTITIAGSQQLNTLTQKVATDLYSFPTTKQHQRFRQLTYELRCLVCQNQNLLESNAKLAVQLRSNIARQIKQGKTNRQIIQYLVTRYGDFVLYKPPLTKATWLLWFGPFLLLITAMAILLLIIFFMSRRQQDSGLNAQQQQQLQQLMDSKK